MSDAIGEIKLTDAQREKQPLLERYGILLAPAELDEAAYVEMSWALHLGRALHPDRPLELRCYGIGGNTYATLAIVNLIRDDGRIDGVLVGDAGSGSSIIWAACPRRYVYPLASINVHESISRTEGWDMAYQRTQLEEQSWQNRQIAALYAQASAQSPEWWLDKMAAGHGVATLIPADELIQIGMARPIEECPVYG